MKSDDVVALIEAHGRRDDERFRSIALAIAANEQRAGRSSGARLLAAAQKLSDRPAELPTKIAAMVREPAQAVVAPVLTDDIRGQIQRIVDEHHMAAVIRSVGLAPIGSVMFTGPPGVGKTMTAEWIGSQIGMPTYLIRTETLISSLLGESGSNIVALFDEIEQRPGVWVFDEFDSLGVTRSTGGRDVGEMLRVTNTMLRCMDRIRDTHLGVIIACTNVPEMIDGALRSRFDATLEFGLPTPKAIAELVETTVAAIDVDFPSPDPACYGGWCHREIVRDIRHRAKGAMVSVVPTMVAAGRA